MAVDIRMPTWEVGVSQDQDTSIHRYGFDDQFVRRILDNRGDSSTFRDQGDNPTAYVDGFRLLTSPVAYISSIPLDPFGYHKWPGNNSFRAPFYEMGAGNTNTMRSTKGINNPDSRGFPANIYMMVSAGPDKVDNTSNDSGFKLTEGAFPWPTLPNTPEAAAAVLALSYDPTNGTKSQGQVYRVAGSKPPGLPYDALFAGGTQ